MSNMNLFKASRQWSTRPADERFWNLQDMLSACEGYRSEAREATINVKDLRVEAQDGEIKLIGKASTPARLTHWSFGQLAGDAGAPAGYLRNLPATLAAQNLNYGLASQSEDREARLLVHSNGDLLVRAITSDRYVRIWNSEALERLIDVLPDGWRVAPARPANGCETRIATDADCFNGTLVKPGDLIGPADLYASDHDMFAFLVNPERTVEGLMRGIIVTNSEVGAACFSVTRFLFDHVCSNHIIWAAKDLQEVRIRHIGTADVKAMRQLSVELVAYANEGTDADHARIAAARSMVFANQDSLALGSAKDQTLEAVLSWASRAKVIVPKKTLAAAYDVAAATPRYGNPNTPWALANGLTEISQQSAFADERAKIDRVAGKILSMAF